MWKLECNQALKVKTFIKKLELFEHGKYYLCVMKVPFLHSGDPQGWLAVVGLAFKHSSELLMLLYLEIFVGNTVPGTVVENLSWCYNMSLKFQENDRP